MNYNVRPIAHSAASHSAVWCSSRCKTSSVLPKASQYRGVAGNPWNRKRNTPIRPSFAEGCGIACIGSWSNRRVTSRSRSSLHVYTQTLLDVETHTHTHTFDLYFRFHFTMVEFNSLLHRVGFVGLFSFRRAKVKHVTFRHALLVLVRSGCECL